MVSRLKSADAIRSAYTYQRDLALGRKAIGAFATSLAVTAADWALNGNITGDGLADRQAQATRRDLDLPKRSVKDPFLVTGCLMTTSVLLVTG